MKKLILISFIVLALGSFAYAQMGMGGCWSNGTQVTSSAQAEDIVKGVIASKDGYAVTGSEEIQLRRGTGYKVAVKNAAGSTEYYVVTPFGFARGPVTNEVADNFCNTGCGYGYGYGIHGMGHGMGHGMMGRGYGMMNNGQASVTTIAQAEEIVKQAIANLKGYTITSTEEVQVRRGTAYKVNVKDSAGNQLYYFVNPFGFARGPLADVAQNN